MLWTVGHSNRSAEDFLVLLRAFDVELLVDVRRYPSSRRHPHFNRGALAAALTDLPPADDAAVSRYEAVRYQLDKEGSVLVDDGLDPAGVAALLLMNNDEENVTAFLAGSRQHSCRNVYSVLTGLPDLECHRGPCDQPDSEELVLCPRRLESPH